MNISWDEKALEKLEKLDKHVQQRIIKKIEYLAENFTFHNIKKLKGLEEYRFRVGDYRIIFILREDQIVILNLGHRKNIYEWK